MTAEGTYNMYCNREPRFYTTVSYNGSWYALAGRKYEFFKNQKDNDYTHDAPQNGYLVRKKVYPQDNPAVINGGKCSCTVYQLLSLIMPKQSMRLMIIRYPVRKR